MTPEQREAWLLARGWVKAEGCWRKAGVKRVWVIANALAAEVIQQRLEAAARAAGHRAMPGSGL